MRCEACRGIRYVIEFPNERLTLSPCPECGATGYSHCCEGDIATNTSDSSPEPSRAMPEPLLATVKEMLRRL